MSEAARRGYTASSMEHVGDTADAGAGVDPDPLSIECRRDGTTCVVAVAGELDLDGGDALESTVAGLVADGVDQVWVEVTEVSFLDSSGLGGLLAARAAVVDAGGNFRLGSVTDSIARVIQLAGVGDLLAPETA